MAESKTAALDNLAVNTIRCLAADMVQKADSGHPGMPMGMAPVAHVLWNKIMNFAPQNARWPNRDRFVLSNGHGCSLLYIMLHLTGFNMPMDELKKFRQLHSLTPGHPEAHITPGVEVTTGPLGQGFANAVGLAIGEAHMGAVFNKPGHKLFDNYTYVFLGDGCLMEGVSCEAASLAGHLNLKKLIAIYDDNQISIDGPTSLAFTEDVPKRFQAYGWNTITVNNGDHDLVAIEKAILEAKRSDKPTLISLKTTIGFGSGKAGSADAHGSPLGPAGVRAAKAKLGMNPDESFVVPSTVYDLYAPVKSRGVQLEQQWTQLFASYAEKYPAEAKELTRRLEKKLPADWRKLLPVWKPTDKADATRNLSGLVLNALAPKVTELIGGSADLSPSNKTLLKIAKDFQKGNPSGRYLRFGVREFGMAAIANGLSAYGALIPYTATFLNFIQYCFPAVRLSALSEVQQIYIMTHDSIFLGEDGPTHQPIEALVHCRSCPNVTTFRPADGNETAGAYAFAMEHRSGPSVIALSRQNLPHLKTSSVENTLKGAYVVEEPEGKAKPDLIFVATGSEVSLAMSAAKLIKGKRVRVVSMPSTELFDQQSVSYRREIITPGVPVVSIEAASPLGWERYAHHAIGISTFGASAPAEVLADYFGLTPEKVVARTAKFLEVASKQAAELSLPLVHPLPTHFNSSL